MGTGYKGKLDLSSLGFESVIILGEIKEPPKNWRDNPERDETSYLVLLDQTRRCNPQIVILALTVF